MNITTDKFVKGNTKENLKSSTWYKSIYYNMVGVAVAMVIPTMHEK